MGSRLTVFPRAALACLRGLGRDADVVFEVINGIAFFTPLWRFLRAPKVVFLQHVHQRHYVMELGLVGRIAGLLLERLPLRLLYRGISICSISQSSRDELIEMGVPAATIEVVYLGVQITSSEEPRATVPTLLYLGRLKRYKRTRGAARRARGRARSRARGCGGWRPAGGIRGGGASDEACASGS